MTSDVTVVAVAVGRRVRLGHPNEMTVFASLFACAAADVTYERVRALVEESPTESLTIEFKQAYSAGVPKSVAAMANSYGGLIVIGITDSGDDRVVGVSADTVTQVANGCHQQLEPPWEPEIIPVPIPTGDAFLVVVRVDPAGAPRPVMMDGKVPVRLSGRNATADRGRVAQLFATAAPAVRTAGRLVNAPTIPTDSTGASTVDFILRTGIWIPVGNQSPGRPVSERSIDALTDALAASALARRLHAWDRKIDKAGHGLHFQRRGFNRAQRVRLTWSEAFAGTAASPIEAVAELTLPDYYGNASTALFTVDILIGLRATAKASSSMVWRLALPDLYETIDALVASATDTAVVTALAGLTGVDPVLVPQPGVLHLITAGPVTDLLHPHGLTPIPGAGTSHGANVLADPARDLTQEPNRHAQIDDWLLHIALDAGLGGMQALLDQYRASRGDLGNGLG